MSNEDPKNAESCRPKFEHPDNCEYFREEWSPHPMETILEKADPKRSAGDQKLPLDLVPDTATALASLAHLQGAVKYGPWNWRATGAKASTYIAAAKRHLMAWTNGEQYDTDSGVHHLGHVLACINILIDCEAAGVLYDDRPPAIEIGAWMEKLSAKVALIREKQ